MTDGELYECTDKELEYYEDLRRNDDDLLWNRIGKFFHHPAVYHAIMRDLKDAKRGVYPIIMSDKNDDEIIRLLNIVAPQEPGIMYF